jgi:hypothetical protein
MTLPSAGVKDKKAPITTYVVPTTLVVIPPSTDNFRACRAIERHFNNFGCTTSFLHPWNADLTY